MEKTEQILTKMQRLKDACGKTNQQIGEIAGLSTATVQRYLSGNIKDAPVDTVSRIIAAMGGDPVDVLGLSPPDNGRKAEANLYERMLSDMRTQHDAETARLRASYDGQIKVCLRWIRSLAIAVSVLMLFIMILLVIDVLNPNVGWIRKLLGFSWVFGSNRWA